MKETKIENIKSKYETPKFIQLGDINIKTLGAHRYRLDSGSQSTCHDESKHGNAYDCDNPPVS